MDLHEWGAAPALNELSDTKQAPNHCVVLGAKQIVGAQFKPQTGQGSKQRGAEKTHSFSDG
jgi:hypothetical protein